MKNDKNVYLNEIYRVLPRVLSLYDDDATNVTFGMGDRLHWAWKLIDFGNGTFQGGVHGLARLLIHDLLPEQMSHSSILKRIDVMFQATGRLCRSNGSMEEAFPYESSFCVTALVAYDLLSALHLLEKRLSEESKERYLEIVKPLIQFLHKHEEAHGFISNHLATAAAALYKWHYLTGEEGESRGSEILERILEKQSVEGWFLEYEGADPGYQSLAAYYLADLHQFRPDLGLLEPLTKSVQFLWHFAHPDGSYGGYYGSRNTRFFFPAGMEALAFEIPEAAALAKHMREAIEKQHTVTLSAMDAGNLIPMFNCYCWAAALGSVGGLQNESLKLPALQKEPDRIVFKDAGLIIDRGESHYTIVSTHKGGVCYHFREGKKPCIDVGVVCKNDQGNLYSSQAYQTDNKVCIDGDVLEISAFLNLMNKRLPSPWQFFILRFLNITFMRFEKMDRWAKRRLVQHLITGKKRASVLNYRKITLGPELKIQDHLEKNTGTFTLADFGKSFSAIHMASQGYWQKQDDMK